ncbi:hypothetical protein jhhlp_008701 [Lomentospora prolificans]|uniref:Origin recognition complex subunit 2 n=1 Tax=Lomentospora prolificans TaxID=41688 RepID=A0A2N3MYR9_9PEZI|nr:hypothetical protein jhhlp_008701 [Lomentospora prolificans]
MPRRKATANEVEEDANGAHDGARPKRKRNPSLKLREIVEDEEIIVSVPKKRKSSANDEAEIAVESNPDQSDPEPEPEPEPEPTTTPKRRGRPAKAAAATPTGQAAETPSRRGRQRNSTAVTPSRLLDGDGITPRRRNAADRSARKKSMRALIRNVVDDEGSEDEEQENLARQIYESSDGEGVDDTEDADGTDVAESVPDTPSKTPRRRGRPRKTKSPSPPRNLPPHEMYFFHNKPGKVKTSDNTLGSLELLTHDQYFAFWNDYENPHTKNLEFLESIHVASFPQWEFEMSEGFTICLYGMGSKRSLMRKLASYIYDRKSPDEDLRIVIVNGYVRTITARDILSTVWSALDPEKPPPAQPAAILQTITSHLSKNPATTLIVLINSIDAPPLRKPATQALLAQLSAHPQVRAVCSADTADFPFLWDISLRSTFNFAFHDATTLAPLAAELDVVDDVHELLGRAARRAGGREAVAFVLKSLTQNARSLYALLVAEVLTALDNEGLTGDGENPGLEYRILYNKAVEAFVCPSSEMAFRQLLREFHDHQMITSSKDALGTEMISVPFRKDEMEAILEDIES